jgi:hypothetical protein
MLSDPDKHRLIIEKPFGRDLASAQVLNQKVKEVCKENQIYRIDHYWVKKPFKTCWSSGLPMPFLNPYGIASLLITSRLRWQKPSV